MKAVVFERTGRAEEVLVAREVAPPKPQPHEILVKVQARPIQPADFLFIEGKYRIKSNSPQIAGLEGCGTVTMVGAEVTGFQTGDRVAFRGAGAWAEYVAVPATRAYPVPNGVADVIAAQFALNPITAWALLFECALPEHARVLVTAGRSVVARLLAALGRRKKLRVTLFARDKGGYRATDATSGQTLSTGATVAAALQGATHDGRFHAVLDAVGGPATLDLIDALEPHGRLISYGVLDDLSFPIRASTVLYRNMHWQGFGIEGWLNRANAQTMQTCQRELWNLFAEEPELMPVLATFDLWDFGAALRAVSESRGTGKVLLR